MASEDLSTVCLVDSFADHVNRWVQNSKDSNTELSLFVGVDIGGTNTRVAIGDKDSYEIACKFKCNSSRFLVKALHSVAEQINSLVDCKKHVKAGCLDAAGPVCKLGECVEITNYKSGEENIHRNLTLDELPSLLFPEGHSRIINDLESACYGISGLSAAKRTGDYFKHFLGPKREPQLDALPFEHHLVIAVGTGMGVGLMMALPKEDDFLVLSLEGGHVLLSSTSVNSERRKEESRMLKFVSCDIYGVDNSLEYEDLASGRGLESLYKFFAQENDKKPVDGCDAESISRLAKEGDEVASKALLYHYLFIARASANLAICMGAKGIFWAGSNQIHNGEFVTKNKEALYREFLHHPKRAWIESVPIYMQTKDFNVNLEGTLHVSRVVLI